MIGFNLKQEYGFETDSVLVLTKQDFEYESKAGNRNFSGSTTGALFGLSNQSKFREEVLQ